MHAEALARELAEGAGELPGPVAVADVLDEAQCVVKPAVLAAFESQWPVDAERFRPAPVHDFLHPPHPAWPPLHERMGWGGMTAVRWGELALAALTALENDG